MDLTLRPWRDEDAPAMGRAVAESLEHLRPWMPWIAHEPLSDDARRALIHGWRRDAKAGGDRVFGMWLGDRVAGGCGLHHRIGPGGLEIGYWVHVAMTRRGIASEAVRQLCAMAFADPAVDRVEIHHDRANMASGRVPARLGFTHVRDRAQAPEAPGCEGVERIWRLERDAWSRSAAGAAARTT